MTVTIKEALIRASELIADVSNTPNLDAELILGHLLGKDRIYMIVNSNESLDEETYSCFNELINIRLEHKPVQYIINKQEFMGMDFHVEEGILIPRPDTEILVETAIGIYGDREIRFIDMCCGSGVIGISLVKFLKNASGILVDISEKAIRVSTQNALALKLINGLEIVKSDLFEDINEQQVDLIVSNPPYIPTEDIKELKSNVKDHEPMLALDGGMDGLYFYDKIIKKAYDYLKADGIILFEIGYDQAEDVIKLMNNTGRYGDYEIYKDLAGHDRVVKACRIG